MPCDKKPHAVGLKERAFKPKAAGEYAALGKSAPPWVTTSTTILQANGLGFLSPGQAGTPAPPWVDGAEKDPSLKGWD
jgi:hypothetical protein